MKNTAETKMCIIRLVYCYHCDKLFNIPQYRPSKRLDFVTIVDDARCKNPNCFYNCVSYPWGIQTPNPPFEGHCGREGCNNNNCRVKRLYRRCDTFEDKSWMHFALRKRNKIY